MHMRAYICMQALLSFTGDWHTGCDQRVRWGKRKSIGDKQQ